MSQPRGRRCYLFCSLIRPQHLGSAWHIADALVIFPGKRMSRSGGCRRREGSHQRCPISSVASMGCGAGYGERKRQAGDEEGGTETRRGQRWLWSDAVGVGGDMARDSESGATSFWNDHEHGSRGDVWAEICDSGESTGSNQSQVRTDHRGRAHKGV